MITFFLSLKTTVLLNKEPKNEKMPSEKKLLYNARQIELSVFGSV